MIDDLELALALIDEATAKDPALRARIRMHLERYLDALTEDYEVDFSLDEPN